MTRLEFYAALRGIASHPGVGVKVRLMATDWLRTPAQQISDAEWHDWLLNMDERLDAQEAALIASGEINPNE